MQVGSNTIAEPERRYTLAILYGVGEVELTGQGNAP
jgi:hypothetical protein